MGVEVVDDLLSNIADGAHGDDDTVSVRSAVVVEELIVRSELLIYLVHVLLDNVRKRLIELVAGLAVLEECISVLVGTAHVRMLRV